MGTLVEDEDLPIWKDRKRILGMPITFTKYEVSDSRLTHSKGLLRTESNELLLYRIMDIRMTRTLGQKLFGVGTIMLYSADQSNNVFLLENIKKPNEVRKFLSKLVEEERTAKGLVGREIYGTASAGELTDLNGDGIPD